MVSHPKTPILNCFYHLLWSYFVTEFRNLLLWFGVFNYKTCRNTSKDLGHNSRTSFW